MTFTKSLIAGLTMTLCAASSVYAAPTTAENHMGRGVACTMCHKTNDTTMPVRQDACLTCHQSYEAVAKRTQAVNPNPHDNHYGKRDCSTCHQGHKPSVVTCDQCHKFSLKAK